MDAMHVAKGGRRTDHEIKQFGIQKKLPRKQIKLNEAQDAQQRQKVQSSNFLDEIDDVSDKHNQTFTNGTQSRSGNDKQLQQLIRMSDEQMLRRYQNDAFFKIKLDLKVKKVAAKKLHVKIKHEPNDSISEEEQLESHNFLTLKSIKNIENENLARLWQKYKRVITDGKKSFSQNCQN